MADSNSGLTNTEIRKRKREVLAVIVVGVLFSLFTWGQFELFSVSHKLPFIHSIFFFGLVNLNIVLLLFLLFLVFRNIVKTFVERKGKLIGSSLKSKLITAFVTFSFVPTLLMFLISVFYINSSFDKWFSVKMAGILKDSLAVTNAYILKTKKQNYHFAEKISKTLGSGSDAYVGRKLKGFQHSYSLDAVEYYPDLFEKPIIAINKEGTIPQLPNVALEFLEKGISHGLEASTIHHFGDGNLVRVIVPMPKGTKGAIVVSSFIPMSLINRMDEIAIAYDSFKNIDPLEYPLKSIYLIILVLMTLVILLCATWFGFHLAKELSTPLLKLSSASESVSHGDYEQVNVISGSEEIFTLVESFNRMVKNLQISETEVREANESLQDTLEILDEHNRYIEVVLSNVSTGVISVDKQGIVTTLNLEAAKLLQLSHLDVIGIKLKKALEADHFKIFDEIYHEALNYRTKSIKKNVQFLVNDEAKSIQITISFLRGENDEDLGTVYVLDDLTIVVNAQRAAAWREVARRIAHEIKNPLTPIKLAAQRLEKKFGGEFSDPAFKMCTNTIIEQVDGLKKLVNEFSNFARLPQAQMQMGNLATVAKEVFVLYETGHKEIEFNFEESEEFPNSMFDREQIKRVIVNLLDNAVAAIREQSSKVISIRALFDRQLNIIKIVIEDSGIGIPTKDLSRIFEPYFSTKEEGTGLGLPIVKRIIEDHSGFIRAYQVKPNGTRFIIELPFADINETV